MADKYASRIKTRTELKDRFITGSIPTEEDYHDLIDSLRHVHDESGLRYLTEIGIQEGAKGVVSAETLKGKLEELERRRLESERKGLEAVGTVAERLAASERQRLESERQRLESERQRLIAEDKVRENERKRLAAEEELRRAKEKQDRVITDNRTTQEANLNFAKKSFDEKITANNTIINTVISKIKALFKSESNDYGQINTAFNRSFGNRANTVAEGDKAFLSRRKLSHGDSIDNIKEMGIYDVSSVGYRPNQIVGAEARELMVYKFDDRIVVQMLTTDDGMFVRRHAGLWEAWIGLADREKVMGDRGVIKGSGNMNPYRTHNGVYHIEPSDTYLMPLNWPWLRVNKEFGTKLMVIKEKNSDEAKQIVFADGKIATRKYYNAGAHWAWKAWTVFEPLSNLVLPPQPLGQLVAIGKMNKQGNLEMGGGINAHKCEMTDMIYYIEFSKPLDTLIYQVNIELGEDNIKDLNRVNIPIVTEKTYTGFKVYFSDSFYNHKEMRTSKNRTLQSHAFDFTVMMWNRKGLIDTSNYYNPPVKI